MFKNVNKNYKVYKFNEIAQNISKRIDPQKTDYTTYVGLEHIEPDSIHLKKHGHPSQVKGQKLEVFPGDVIFGKRGFNLLRKLAVSDFNGICSAHAFVLRANENVILPEILPFFLLSDQFFKKACAISVGSLSKTINWRDLAKQEFLLPPKDQQAKIAELLWAMDDACVKISYMNNKLKIFKESNLKNVFKRENCRKLTINKISENLDNIRVPIKKSDRKFGGIPYYGASGIVDYVEGHIYNEPILLISEDGENLNSRNLPIAYEVDGKCWVNNHAHVIKIINEDRYLVSEFLNYSDISSFISVGTRPKITKSVLEDLPIYLPIKEKINYAKSKLKSIDTAIVSSNKKIQKNKLLLKSLINEIFAS